MVAKAELPEDGWGLPGSSLQSGWGAGAPVGGGTWPKLCFSSGRKGISTAWRQLLQAQALRCPAAFGHGGSGLAPSQQRSLELQQAAASLRFPFRPSRAANRRPHGGGGAHGHMPSTRLWGLRVVGGTSTREKAFPHLQGRWSETQPKEPLSLCPLRIARLSQVRFCINLSSVSEIALKFTSEIPVR